jgi:plastocyanin
MSKGVVIFIVLIIAGVSIEFLLLLRIINLPAIHSSIVPPVPEKSSIQNIAPIGGAIIMVKLTNNGFEPNSITTRVGDKVIWTNSTTSDATVNSDSHPIHDLYPFLNLGNFPPGKTVRVILREQGKFMYHNHLNPSQTGTIIVK